jgi:SAM-dependent methyltransferase
MLPELYHAHHNQHLEDLPFWLSIGDQAGDSILELGCGTGRVLLPMLQAGFRVVGIDHDLAMLQFLRKRSIGENLAPKLIAGDMCRFNLAMFFSLIVLACNTYSTLDKSERLGCLTCVQRQLKPGGLFAVSLPNPASLANLPAHSEAELEDEFLHPVTENPVQVSSSWQRTKDAFIITWIYDHLIPDGSVERFSVEAFHHLATVDDYKNEIQAMGMKIIDVFGDYDRSTYRSDSPYFICISSA